MSDPRAMYEDGIASWRKVLIAVPAQDRMSVFRNAARDVAGYVARGCDKLTAVDQLSEIAEAIGLVTGEDVDAVQSIIADAFTFDQVPDAIEDLVEPRRSNGKGKGNGIAPPGYEYVPRAFDEIERRLWLHAKHYVRGYVVMTIAPGGYGKSSLVLCNALEMATGRGLIGPAPIERTRVWYWNAEESERAEIERRIAALCIAHSIRPAELTGWLYLGKKIAGDEWRLAGVDRHGKLIPNTALVEHMIEYIGDHQIGCTILDPMIAFHRVPEFDTRAVEGLIKGIVEPIAIATNSCIEFSHHTRKTSAAFGGGEVTADDSRGAGAAVAAVRSVRVINRMTREEASAPKIADDMRRRYLKISRDKENMTPPSKAKWIFLSDVEIGNAGPNGEPSDRVQAATAWAYPTAFDGVAVETVHYVRAQVAKGNYRRSSQAGDWVGYVVMEHLGLDRNDKADKARVNTILKAWFDNKVLDTAERRDPETRKMREYVIAGSWRDVEAESVEPPML